MAQDYLPTKIPKKYVGLIAMTAIIIIFLSIVAIVTQLRDEVIGWQLLPSPTPTECTDSDLGKTHGTSGSCVDESRLTKYDNCVRTGVREPFKLEEWYCENNKCISEIVDCAEGFDCNNGQCIKV